MGERHRPTDEQLMEWARRERIIAEAAQVLVDKVERPTLEELRAYVRLGNIMPVPYGDNGEPIPAGTAMVNGVQNGVTAERPQEMHISEQTTADVPRE